MERELRALYELGDNSMHGLNCFDGVNVLLVMFFIS